MKLRNLLVLAIASGVVATFCLSIAGGGGRTTVVNGIAWRNSLADATAEAKRTGKPILLLSMFGRIDEEMPCANARTLRATLFKDPQFKALVSNDVVPAWEMVREVPKVQIDLGGGKKLTRTIRGNAVIYILNKEGKVVDAYPGVYTAKDFMPAVRETLKLAGMDEKEVLYYHVANGRNPGLVRATMGKAVLESPTLKLVGAQPTRGAVTPATATDPAKARFLQAAMWVTDMSLNPMSSDQVLVAITGEPEKGKDPAQLAAEILTKDSENNMKNVRPVVHLYFASEKKLPTPAEARDAILGTLLKIPYKDPYFGLKDVLLPGTPD